MFKVTAVHGSKPWSNGQNIDYFIELEGLEGRHTLTQKPTTPAPEIGQDLWGHPEDGGTWPSGDPKPPKFRKGQRGGFGSGGGGNSRAKDPAERESIERQVAAKCATDLLVALMAQGVWKPEGVDALGEAHGRLMVKVAGGIRS